MNNLVVNFNYRQQHLGSKDSKSLMSSRLITIALYARLSTPGGKLGRYFWTSGYMDL